MSAEWQDRGTGSEPPAGKKRRPWFRPNRSGPGWHPSSWQGGVIVGVVIAAIITLVVLLRTGVL